MRLGRILCGLAPHEAEAFGLVALMEVQASRLRARIGSSGEPVTLLDQDRTRWDRVLITHALGALERAESLGGTGTYVLQAAIAACHARAGSPEDTDWGRIASIYEVLAAQTGSPIVELNRAVAVAMAEGPAAGLAIVDDLRAKPALRGYHLLPSVRGDLLFKLGRRDEARAEFEAAAEMTGNEQEQELLRNRAAAC
jgi:predicted RNA polymerase sigma factor